MVYKQSGQCKTQTADCRLQLIPLLVSLQAQTYLQSLPLST